MKKLLGRAILGTLGWRATGALPANRKCVIIFAPHTSNWDMPIFLALGAVLGVQSSWMGKESLLRWPFGGLVRALGGVPIDRTKAHSVVQQMVDHFAQADALVLALSAEGSRTRGEFWKSGFYRIALEANVPIALAFADYARKVGGLGPLIHLTGDVVADMDKIRAFYADKRGKFADQFTTPRLKEEMHDHGAPRGPRGDSDLDR